MRFVHNSGDLDIYLQRNNGTPVQNSISSDDHESLRIAALGTGWWILRVRDVLDAHTNVYSLDIRTPGCDCEHGCGKEGLTDCEQELRWCVRNEAGCLEWAEIPPQECLPQ